MFFKNRLKNKNKKKKTLKTSYTKTTANEHILNQAHTTALRKSKSSVATIYTCINEFFKTGRSHTIPKVWLQSRNQVLAKQLFVFRAHVCLAQCLFHKLFRTRCLNVLLGSTRVDSFRMFILFWIPQHSSRVLPVYAR